MKALVKAKSEPGLWIDDIPQPEVGPNDVLIRVHKTSICGTDLHIESWDEWAQRTITVPMAIGHEFMGTVERFGSEVSGLEVGQRVSAEGHIVCGRCRNCQAGNRHLCIRTVGLGVNRPGAFAEYVSVPGGNVQPIPDDVSDDIGCILDPLGNATHTALSFNVVGEDVVITGAGPIGLMATAIARHVGARYIVVTDVNDFRLGIAAAMGADRAINVLTTQLEDTMWGLGMKEGFDVGLEMSGVSAALHDGELAFRPAAQSIDARQARTSEVVHESREILLELPRGGWRHLLDQTAIRRLKRGESLCAAARAVGRRQANGLERKRIRVHGAVAELKE